MKQSTLGLRVFGRMVGPGYNPTGPNSEKPKMKHKRMYAYTAISVFASLILWQTAFGQDPKPRAANDQVASSTVTAVAVTTLADEIESGTGGLAIDADGNVFSADFGSRLGGRSEGGDRVYKIDPQGNVSLFCREMRGASGNTFDADGNLYQSSVGGNFVSKVTPEGKVSVLAREGLMNPVGLCFGADGNLYVCNCGNGSIQQITLDGESNSFVRSPLLKCPNGITLADDGNFYAANFYNGDVIKIDPDGNASKLATLPGNNNGHLTCLNGALYVVARTANQIYRVTYDGQSTLFVGSGERGKADGDPLQATLSLPNDIGVSPDGRFMYINETGPIEGDPRILTPTRIRRIELAREE